jgi:protein TonB
VEVPDVLPEEDPVDLGVEGGIEGGVEGGVAGGVAGGVVGGLIAVAPPPVRVRVGGNIKAPRLLHRVDPAYPPLARQARITGQIFLQAVVDRRGHVQDVRVIKGIPLLSEAALEAVKQWRYLPLLLNGEPVEFELTVTVTFGLAS